MANYQVFPPTSFPAVLANGKLGTKYEIAFTVPGVIERDTIQVESIDPATVDKLIKEKIASIEAILKLGR